MDMLTLVKIAKLVNQIVDILPIRMVSNFTSKRKETQVSFQTLLGGNLRFPSKPSSEGT
jgi:hypothetical protein